VPLAATGREIVMPRASIRLLLAAALATGIAAPVTAQSQPQPQSPPRASAPEAERPRGDDPRKLPAEQTTSHVIELPGRTLRFTVTVGSIPLYDGEGGALIAEVATMAFRRSDAGTVERPVAFLFNGGPGAASAYLSLGAVGPWRLPLAVPSPSASPVTVPNAETWLDFADLVFVDPVGAGYSWMAPRDELRRRFWSVEGDASSLATVVRKWIEREGRQRSPKILVGESYGGFRVPRIARELQTRQGVGIAGLVLVSPVLDFGWRFQPRHAPMRWVTELPSMAAATALSRGGPLDRAALAEVERYAAGPFMADLLRGPGDAAAVERMSTRVAALTGLDPALVRRLAGRVDTPTYVREANRATGRVASLYDATITGPDPDPDAMTSRPDDPVLDGIDAPLSSAMTDLYRRLGWKIDRPYRLLNREVNASWSWGGRRVSAQVVDDLREALALDPAMRALVVHGAADLVTPYFETQLILAQLPAFGPERPRQALYPGGHMFYARDDARAAFRDDARRLVEGVSPPGP